MNILRALYISLCFFERNSGNETRIKSGFDKMILRITTTNKSIPISMHVGQTIKLMVRKITTRSAKILKEWT